MSPCGMASDWLSGHDDDHSNDDDDDDDDDDDEKDYGLDDAPEQGSKYRKSGS